ncbi:MAG TPA: hypothetical protein VNF50_11755 [Acidimicrobiales bacterium]|nr:hypothetical protein [Acidimicrobiales bacterium]
MWAAAAVVTNLRLLASFRARQAERAARLAEGLAPRKRRRRRSE